MNADGYLGCSSYTKFPYEQYYHFKKIGQVVEIGFLTLLRCFYDLISGNSHFKENDTVILYPVIHRFTDIDNSGTFNSVKMLVTAELLQFVTLEMTIFIKKYDKFKGLTIMDKKIIELRQELEQFYKKNMECENFNFNFA